MMLPKNKSSWIKIISVLMVVFVTAITPLVQGYAAGSTQDGDIIYGRHRETGEVNFIGTRTGKPFSLDRALSRQFAQEDRASIYLEHFSIELGLGGADDSAQPVSSHLQTNRRSQVTRYQQYYRGVPVLAGEFVVNLNEQGALLSIQGEASPGLSLSVVPQVSAEDAITAGQRLIQKLYDVEPGRQVVAEPELWIFDERLLLPSTRPVELVWRFEISTQDATPIRELILVNAVTGNISLHFNQIDTAWTGSFQPGPAANPGDRSENGSLSLLPPLLDPSPTVYFDLVVDEARNLIYASDRTGDKVDIISTTTLRIVDSMSIGDEPTGMDLSPDGDELAVALFGDGRISFVDLDTRLVTGNVYPSVTTGPNRPYDLLYGRTNRLYSVGNPGSSGFDYVHVFDTSTDTEVGTSTAIMRMGPRLSMTDDHNSLYISAVNQSPQKIHRFDISTDTPSESATSPHGGVQVNTLVTLGDGSKVFSSRGQVWSGDLTTLLENLDDSGEEIELIAAQNVVAISTASQIVFIDTGDYSVAGRFPLPGKAGVARATSDGSTLYVSTSDGIVKISLGSFPPFEPTRLTYTANNDNDLPGTLVCDQDQPACTGGSDQDADKAHLFAAQTYGFFFNHHNRNSIDDAGMPLVSSVHYDVGYYNAFWDGSISQMVYGDTMSRGDDVVAHELTHGVTEHESNLFYYYQSGAINESFSDLWGEFMDLRNAQGNDDLSKRWLMGEDLAGAIRDMADPPVYGDPDRMSSPYYYTGSADLGYVGDNGGVHTNSGVNNKAVYLMVDGGSFNGRVIEPLGLDKVAALYYTVQTTMLTSGSDYLDLYNALSQSCASMIAGPEGITAGDCVEVQDAIEAVEMADAPSPDYNPAAATCPGGAIQQDLFFDDLESGTPNFVSTAVQGVDRWYYASGYASSGDAMLWADDSCGTSINGYECSVSDSFVRTSTDVNLPLHKSSYLHFDHAFGFEDPNFDGGWLEYSTNNGVNWHDAGGLIVDGRDYTGSIAVGYGNPNAGRTAFIGDSHGYVSTRLDLSQFAGQSIRFRWRVSTDNLFGDVGWFIDDVRIYTCSIAEPGPVEVVILKSRLPGSIRAGSSNLQWYTKVAPTDSGLEGKAFRFVTWLHVPVDWQLPWGSQYSFTGDFSNLVLSKDSGAQTWISSGNCEFAGGPPASGYKWRAWLGPLEYLPSSIDSRVDNAVNLRGGLSIPATEARENYREVQMVLGTFYDTDGNGFPDSYSCYSGTSASISITD